MKFKKPFIRHSGWINHLFIIIILLVNLQLCFGQITNDDFKFNDRELNHISDTLPQKPLLTNEEYGRMIKSILHDQEGNLWISTTWSGVFRYDSASASSNFKSYTHFTEEQGLCSNMINAMYQDRDGLIWFATDKGVCYYDGTSFTPLYFPELNTTTNYLKAKSRHGAQPEVESIMQDHSGNLWFGIWGPPGTSGAYRYNPYASRKDDKSFTQFAPETRIQGIVEDPGGGIWLGNKRYHPSTANATSNGVTDLSTMKGIFKDAVFCNLKDLDGNLWFGVRSNGLYRFDGTAFSYFSKSDGLLDNRVNSLFEDSSGRLWLGSDILEEVRSGGLCRFDPIAGNATVKSFISFPQLNRLGMHSVLAIAEDQMGNLWLGGRGGKLFLYDGKEFYDYSAIIPKD